MRLVLDTDVMVAAIRSDAGAARRLLLACLQRQHLMLVSVPLMIEYEAVMTRSEHLDAAGLTARDVNALLDAVVVVAKPVRFTFLWRPMLKDPDDDMVLETAVNGRADRLVTFNRRDFGVAGRQFGIGICSPGDALEAQEKRK